jgi:hypothetical protein
MDSMFRKYEPPPLTEEYIDGIVNEFFLIQQKKSNKSRAERDGIVRVIKMWIVKELIIINEDTWEYV